MFELLVSVLFMFLVGAMMVAIFDLFVDSFSRYDDDDDK